jgi:hypothetical protein
MADSLSRLSVLVRQLQGRAPQYRGTVTVTWPGGSDTTSLALGTVLPFTPVGFVATADQAGVGAAYCYADGTVLHVQTSGFTPAAAATSLVHVVAW